MQTYNSEKLTIEELENKIEENKQKMILLQKKIDKNKKDKKIQFQKLTDLTIALSKTEKKYYDYRNILSDADLFGLTKDEFDTIEAMMLIYKQKIVLLRDKLENIL